MKNYISVTQYSERFNLSKTQVMTMIKNDELPYTKSVAGKKYFILIDEEKTVSLEELNEKMDLLIQHLGVKYQPNNQQHTKFRRT